MYQLNNTLYFHMKIFWSLLKILKDFNKNIMKNFKNNQTVIQAKILPLPNILIVTDSGLSITHVSPILQMAGLSKVNFSGSTEENFAALICNPILTRHIWFSEISPL